MTDAAKQTIQTWCAGRFSGDGILAVGGGFPDGAVFTASVAPEFVLAHNEEVWRSVGVALNRTQESGAPSEEMLWSFEEASLLTARRTDGCWVGVFFAQESTKPMADMVRTQLQEFQNLALAD